MKVPARYKISGNSIGGGMGDIHACIDTHLERKVVFKVLKAGQEVRRLFDEQKALLQIRSKHVVQLYDIVEVDVEGQIGQALVLEYIEGNPLKFGEFVADVRLLHVLWQVSCGLSEIHKAGVIHRDIKPANIMLDSSGVIKILDFGLSRNQGEDAHTVSRIGTPAFMAPELWGTQDISFDQKIDIYSFAITAISLLKGGRIPKELTEFPPGQIKPGALESIFSGFPKDVIKILEFCLSREPSHRPSSSEIESVLKKYLLEGKHRALLVAGDKVHELHRASPQANITINPLGSIGIKYTGTEFVVVSFSGAVTVNNSPIADGMSLPGCCVLTFGVGRYRQFITFNISNPEVMS